MKYLCLLFLVLNLCSALAQKKLPIIQASSKSVSIKDDGYLDTSAWTLSPEAKPDIYMAHRSLKPKYVVFYTDIDSIQIKVRAGGIYDFIILYQGQDSCYTRIVSSKLQEIRAKKNDKKCDTIPFNLTQENAIHVKGLLNKQDTLNLYFDIGTIDVRLDKATLAKNKLTGLAKLQLGTFVIDSPKIQGTNNAAYGMNGRFGWRIFDGKILEIDYEKSHILVHSRLPKIKKGFVKSRINFVQSLFCVESTIKMAEGSYHGNFLFDTGSNLAMILDSAWMSKNNFPNDQIVLKKSALTDGTGRKYETTIVTIPHIVLNGFDVKNVVTSKLGYKSPVGLGINYFGNALLKGFNMLIDLKKDNIYLKTNSLSDSP